MSKPVNIKLTDAQRAAIGFAYLRPRAAAKFAIGWWLFKNGIGIVALWAMWYYGFMGNKF